MSLLQKIASSLGDPYTIRTLDQESLIYRQLGNYEFEVSGIQSASGTCILYVRKENPHILVGIYKDIPVKDLKDILGITLLNIKIFPRKSGSNAKTK